MGDKESQEFTIKEVLVIVCVYTKALVLVDRRLEEPVG